MDDKMLKTGQIQKALVEAGFNPEEELPWRNGKGRFSFTEFSLAQAPRYIYIFYCR